MEKFDGFLKKKKKENEKNERRREVHGRQKPKGGRRFMAIIRISDTKINNNL